MNRPSVSSVPDLSNCGVEPIHTPGSIQPHGFLFVLEPGSWIMAGASANARDFFWREATALIGGEIAAVLGDAVVPALERSRVHPEFTSRAIMLGNFPVEIGGETQPFSLVAHASGNFVILEGERAADEPPLQAQHDLQGFLNQLSATESLEELHQLAVAEVRRVTGFDRCLLYQFDADWNGFVIAEDRNEHLPRYLNQCFPASDIPPQARELYRRNRLRLIPTNTYRPVPIILRSGGPASTTLDLSLSVLRSVSPIHLEYMRNMGTGSSMSVSVLRDGNLWGLLACHSLAPRFVPFEARAACDLLAQFLALQLAAREQARELAYRVELTGVLTRLLGAMARSDDFFRGAAGDDLLRLGNASGVACVRDSEILQHGRTPPPEAIAPLAAWVAAQDKTLLLWDNLPAVYPAAAAFRETASGVLAVMLRREPLIAVLWFRPEIVQVIEWGGEPRKAIEAAGEGRVLHPRKSFETWRETVRGKSRPWESAVVNVVGDFQRAVTDIILDRAR